MLNSRWSWLREDRPFWSLNGSELQITTQRGALNGTDYNDVRNMLLQDAPASGDFRFFTKLDFSPDSSLHNAGLVYYVDDDNYIRVSRGRHDAVNGVWMETEVNGWPQIAFVHDISANPIYLRLSRVSGDVFRSMYSINGTDWTMIYERILGFPAMPAKVGLQAANGQGNVTTLRIPARFDYFRIILGDAARPPSPRAVTPELLGSYPSPARAGGDLTVNFTLPGADGSLRLTDVLGRVLWNGTARPAGTEAMTAVIPLHSVPAGTYMLLLEANGRLAQQTVVVY